ncbi:DUF3300 domain-containing protein [Methylobacter sp. sgz302048]|uniref:DUF3300 domain-containing protein n=1 Tax=Methylobacter sp. sgz302048 TaxID=3455945 RepID=UPI003FA0AA7D
MTSKQVNTNHRRQGHRILLRAVLLILAMHAVGCDKEEQQEAKTAAQGPSSEAPPSKTESPGTPPSSIAEKTPTMPPPGTPPLTGLESLVAPIALYPDPLLAEVLVAATYPLEVVQAARWLETKPDPATVRDKNWDASVVRLTAVPSVIAMMNKHLDWTTQLGDAFLSNPSELMDAVQALRKRASDAGFLKDSEQQKVEAKAVSLSEPAEGPEAKVTPAVVTKEVITIEPAKADTLSVPSYNSEAVYGAPLAPPPATTTGYAAGAAPSYYPAYYPPATTTTTTTTSSSSDQWINFGTGAVVGGLLTWGIMEWADDDWDDYHVSHYYGDAVCHGGNCWHGGGGGAYGGRYGNVNVDRGDINRDVNISGNEININRESTFKSDQLTALKDQSNRWRPDARHRRGQPYPQAAQQRLGRLQQPALAGSRLSGAENLPAEMRGYGNKQAAQLAAQPRPSSSEIQQRLATKPGKPPPPSKAEARKRPLPKSSESALADLRASGQRVKAESRRGASSVNSRSTEVRKSTGKQGAGISRQRPERTLAESRRPLQQGGQRSAYDTQRFQNRRNQEVQRSRLQQRREASRPSAFESVRDRGRSRDFSSRGNASRVSAQSSRQIGASGGGRAAGGGAARTRGGGRR